MIIDIEITYFICKTRYFSARHIGSFMRRNGARRKIMRNMR